MSKRLFVVFALFFVALTSPALADSIASVVAVLGNPTSSGPGGNRTLAAGNPIFENDKITVTVGNAQILFTDGTKLVVGPSSALLINKYLMRGTSNTAQDFSIKALRGTFRFITGNSPKSAYKIQTANATIGIRGTAFDFWVQNVTGVALLKGKVRLCDNTKNKSSCVNLNPTCEVGTTENATAKKFKGEPQGRRLLNNLPFIVNQTGLTKGFRLNTDSCRAALAATQIPPRSSSDSDSFNRPPSDNTPPPPPPPPPRTGDQNYG